MSLLRTTKLRKLRNTVVATALLAFTLLVVMAIMPNNTYATSYTWDGGGTTNNWSDCDNWSSNICPTSGDTVTFNGTSTKSATVNSSFTGTITTININSGYTGTISLSRSLTVSSAFSQAAGTFNAGSQTLHVGGAFTLSAGTFNAGSGTVDFNGTSSATLSCNDVSFNSVTFTNTSGTKTVSSDCTLPMGSSPSANSGGSITLDGGILLGTGTLTTSGTLTLSEAAGSECYGAGGGTGSTYDSGNDGGDATGAGCGGGGASWYGGAGGNGLYGGGGGGASGGHVVHNGGNGGAGMVVISPDSGSDVAKTSGTSWTVPSGVSSIKIWAIGAAGGGAGVPGSDGTSGGGGGAGGTVYKTFSVTPGDTVSYSLGTGGAGGGSASDGSAGGNTTVTVGATTITAGGGAGGTYNNNASAAGGSYSGGDGGAAGAAGSGATGDDGGGGGGAIGGGGSAAQNATDSIGGNDGTPVNSPDTTNSPVKLGSYAGDFTGTGARLSIPNNEVDLSGDWSVGMWVDLASTAGTNPRTFSMVDSTHGINLQTGYRSTTPYPYVRINGSSVYAAHALTTGTWHHLVYESSGGTITIHIDGTAYSTSSGGPSADTSSSAIGADGAGSYGMNGYLDDVVLYNRALTGTEVAGRYNSGSGTENLSGSGWNVSSAAVSQWHMNESYWGSSGGGSGSPTDGGHAGDSGGTIVDVSGLVSVLNGLGYGANYSSMLSGFSGLSANNLTMNESYDFSSFSTFTTSGNLIVDNSSTFTAPSGTATVNGYLLTDSGSLGGSNTFNAGSGTLNVNGGLYVGAFTADASTFNGGSGTLNVSGGLYVGPIFGSDNASVFNASSGTTNVTGGFGVTSASPVFNADGGTLNVSGDFSLTNSSNFSADTGTVNFNGAASGSLTCSNASFNRVNFTHTAGVKTVGSDCSLPLGSSPTVGSGSGGNTVNNINGSAADGLGSGGGGAGYYGGNGGDGLYGGGGGGAAGYSSANRIGGSGGSGSVIISPDSGSDVVLTTDNSWKVPAGVTSIKVWAVGAGGGGAGSTSTNATAGGGGGAGGVVYQTFSVSPDDLITYSVGAGGAGGIDTDNGSGGGDTTVTVGATTITANGGAGGTYNDGSTAAGGSYTGGDGGVDGGDGTGATGNTGGGGGGGIGGSAPTEAGNAGDTGGQAADVSDLFSVLTGLGYATTGPGAGGGSGSGTSYGVVLNGTLSGSGTLNGSSDLTLASSGSLSGFSGVAANNLTVNGTYNFGSYSTFTASGDFAVGSSGNFTAPSGTSRFSGNFTLDPSSTFSANGGTVNFRGGTATLSCGNKTFNLVTFTHSSGTKIVGSDCSLPLGSNPTVGSGTSSLSLSGTLSGSGKLTMGGSNTGTLTLGSGGSLSGFSGLAAKALTVNGTYNFGSYSPFTVSGNFTVNSGASFTAPAGTASFSSNFTISSGATFNANGGTLDFNGGSATLTCGGKTFYRAILSHASGTKTVDGNCSLPLGSNPTLGDGGSTILSSTLNGSGTLTTTGTLTLASGGSLSGWSGLSANNLNVNGTYNFSSYGTLNINKNLTIGSSGVLTAPSGTTSLGGNLTNSGTFNANGGTFVLDGSNQTLSGNTAFYNLSKAVTSADTLTFAAGSTQTILGTLTLQGSSGNLLSLVSSIPSTAWAIYVQGATNTSYLDVADSASIGNIIIACNSIDNGGNSGWSFNPATCNGGTPGSSGSNSTWAISALTNFNLNQAALINHARGSDNNNGAFTLSDNTLGGLASQLYSFLKNLPAGQGLLAAAKEFGQTLLAGLGVVIVSGLLFVWRRRHLEAVAEREGSLEEIETTPFDPTPQADTTIEPSSNTEPNKKTGRGK